mgnify:FL=1|jgi:DNA-binding MarR family transcriptional regulator
MKSKKIELDATLSKETLERLSHFRFRLRSFLRVSEDICRDAQITPLQYLLLLHVRGIPGKDWANIGELAERLQAKHHGVVALVNRCEEAELVERRPAETDKRQVAVHLTAKGEAILQQLAALHQPELQRLREEFSLPGWTAN